MVGPLEVPAMMTHWLRRLLCRLLGAPTCESCQRHMLSCIRRCGLTAAERIDYYVLSGRFPR